MASLGWKGLRVAFLSRVLLAKVKFVSLLKIVMIIMGLETLLLCLEGPAICLQPLPLNPIFSATRYVLKMHLNLFLGPKFIHSE
jgi:hypothetical protein